MKKRVYFAEELTKRYPNLYYNLVDILKKHKQPHGILKTPLDIWIRDFMPLVIDGKSIQYDYRPDYLEGKKYGTTRTDPNKPIKELGLETTKIDLVLDGGNVVKHKDTAILTDKIFTENKGLSHEEILAKLSMFIKNIVIITRDQDPEEIYGHADGMVRFISEHHLLVNSQYPNDFKQKLHNVLKEKGFKIAELKVKKDTANAWGYINFLHLDDLIILPSIDKENDEFVKSQLEKLYKDTTIELCDARELIKEGGVFNCISWEVDEKLVNISLNL